MSEHPIEGLMKNAMESIKEMVDVNTVVGDPVETPDGSVIIPISRVACGFAAGGGDYQAGEGGRGQESPPPSFGGGSGAGVSVQPMGFLVVGNGQIRLLPVDGNAMYDRLIDMMPNLIDKLQAICNRDKNKEQGTDTPVI
ncbi:sporulation protein YtfJ [Desulfohalotomaculum tongense]|uniref:GerW family sporulation protein n=1 Tax=Desulforadius tongensis TaxID=1216062 RepID=UPI00195C1526|nr:GerW family sporulation protein [Desulforadius tongensis]MBM7854678.1 sporulation protein YtfJ [Desulforadius tongensis]